MCILLSERGCATKTGWIPKGDHIYSGVGHADDAYLVLGLRVGGFRGSEGSYQGKAAKVSTISFVFETQCTGSCEFYFMQVSHKGTVLPPAGIKMNPLNFVY